MLNSKDFDFSFSGLKTAVLYLTASLKKNNQNLKSYKLQATSYKLNLVPVIAAEFQQAVIDVLVSKTIKAAKEYKARTIILGGGVAANKELRKQMKKSIQKELPATIYKLPATSFCGDNAAMIALPAYFRARKKEFANPQTLKANGNLTLF